MRVIAEILRKPGPHGIQQAILHLRPQSGLIAYSTIMVAALPDAPAGSRGLGDDVGGIAFESMHDFGKREFTQPKNQMYMIRHHHDSEEIDYLLLIQPARAAQHGPRRIRIVEKFDAITTTTGQQIAISCLGSTACS